MNKSTSFIIFENFASTSSYYTIPKQRVRTLQFLHYQQHNMEWRIALIIPSTNINRIYYSLLHSIIVTRHFHVCTALISLNTHTYVLAKIRNEENLCVLRLISMHNKVNCYKLLRLRKWNITTRYYYCWHNHQVIVILFIT